MANLIYSPKDILQQEFKQKMRGYDPVEVDEFLDNVIKDYESFNKQIMALQEENERLNAKVGQMSKFPGGGASRTPNEQPKSSAAVTNFDILKRLSNLEREVFGKKLDNSQENFSGSYSTTAAKEPYRAERSERERPERAERTERSALNTDNYTNSDSSDMDKTRLF